MKRKERSFGQFSAEWNRGFEQVYVLRLTTTRQLYDPQTRSWRRYIFRCLWLGALPVLFNFLLFVLWPEEALYGLREIGWLCAFGVINAFMLFCASVAWMYVQRRAVEIDDMVSSPQDDASLAAALVRFLGHRRQALLPTILPVASAVFLYAAQADLQPVLEIGPASYAALAMSGAIGGNVSYFLFIAPNLLAVVFTAGNLRLRWQDPASTPGLKLIAGAIALSGLLLLLGTVSVTILGFYLPRTILSPAVQGALIAFMAYATLLITRLVVISLIRMRTLVARHINGTLTLLNNEMAELSMYLRSGPRRRAKLSELSTVYTAVASASRLPFSTVAMVQYAAALVGTLSAFVLGLIYR